MVGSRLEADSLENMNGIRVDRSPTLIWLRWEIAAPSGERRMVNNETPGLGIGGTFSVLLFHEFTYHGCPQAALTRGLF